MTRSHAAHAKPAALFVALVTLLCALFPAVCAPIVLSAQETKSPSSQPTPTPSPTPALNKGEAIAVIAG